MLKYLSSVRVKNRYKFLVAIYAEEWGKVNTGKEHGYDTAYT